MKEHPGRTYIACLGISMAFFLATLFSCTYKPTDEYFRDLRHNPPDLTITGPFGPDTMVFNNSSLCELHVRAGEDYKYVMQLYQDGIKRLSLYSPTGDFEIDPSGFTQPGMYTVHLKIFFNTKTGSIADALGAEAYLFEKDMTLVNTTYKGTPFSSSLTFSNVSGKLQGKLIVSEKCPPVRKIVVKKSYGYYEPFSYLTTVTGKPPFIFYDDSYAGESCMYKIYAYDSLPNSYPLGDDLINKVCEIRNPDYSVNDRGTRLTMTWEKTQYPSACSGYRIYYSTSAIADPSEIFTINNPDQTTFETEDLVFPGGNWFYISAIPRNPLPDYNAKLAVRNYSCQYGNGFNAGLPSFQFFRIWTPAGNDFYVYNNCYYLYRYSSQTLEITDKIPLEVSDGRTASVSPNNKYLLAFLNSNIKFLLYDVTSRAMTYVPMNKLFTTGTAMGSASVSDNGIAVVASAKRICLYDFVHQQKLYERALPVDPTVVEISPSGGYFFVDADKLYLYSYSGGNIAEKWNSGGACSALHFSFLSGDDSRAVIIENKTFSIRNCSDWSLIRSFPVDFDVFGNMDYNSGRLLGWDGSHYRIYDINSGMLLKEGKTGKMESETIIVLGNTLYSRWGKKIIIF